MIPLVTLDLAPWVSVFFPARERVQRAVISCAPITRPTISALYPSCACTNCGNTPKPMPMVRKVENTVSITGRINVKNPF